MNDLSGAAPAGRRRFWDPIPSPIPCILLPLFLVGLAFSVFILAVVRNASSLVFILSLAVLVISFVSWNLYMFRTGGSLLLFLDRMPLSDLASARDGQIVKIAGFASCGDVPLESSYEKIERCVYSSTLLYEYRGFRSKMRNAGRLCISWDLTYVERCIADFYITDKKSGTRALVKAGSNSKINPLVAESQIVNTTRKNRELSSTLKKWLGERCLSTQPRRLRVKEGYCNLSPYIKEGSSLTVMGMLSQKNGVLMILPPPEPITTGCLLRKCLLPFDVDGLVLRYDRDDSVLTPGVTQLKRWTWPRHEEGFEAEERRIRASRRRATNRVQGGGLRAVRFGSIGASADRWEWGLPMKEKNIERARGLQLYRRENELGGGEPLIEL